MYCIVGLLYMLSTWQIKVLAIHSVLHLSADICGLWYALCRASW